MALAISPDSQTAVTGGNDKAARLWQIGTAQPFGPPLGHNGTVWAVAFSPDGRTVLTGSDDHTARLWSAATCKLLLPPLTHPSQVQVWAVAYSPDGQTLLTGSTNNNAMLWEAASGKLLGAPLQHQGCVAAVAFGRDSETVLTGSYDRTARLWHSSTGQPKGQPLPHLGMVQAVAFSPDGRSALTASWEGVARLWEVAPGHSLGVRLKLDGLRASAFSPDGQLLATANGTVRLWEAATGKPILPALPDDAWWVTFSSDGKAVVTACKDKNVRLWEVATGKLIGRPIVDCKEEEGVLALSADGRWLLTGDSKRKARLWEVATGQPRGIALPPTDGIQAVAFSSDGRWIVTGSGKAAYIWDIVTGRPNGGALPHRDNVVSVGFSSDSRMVLTTCLDGTAQRWDRATHKPVGRGFQSKNGVHCESLFGPDGRTLLMVQGDGQARFADVITGRPLGAPAPHSGPIKLVAFAPDGRSVLLREPGEHTLRLWEVPAPLQGEVERIVCWTEIITGMELDAEGVVHVLDAATWHERGHRLDELGGPPEGGTRHGQGASHIRPDSRPLPPMIETSRLEDKEVPLSKD